MVSYPKVRIRLQFSNRFQDHRKPDPVLVEDAFSCYNKPVIVAQREALGD